MGNPSLDPNIVITSNGAPAKQHWQFWLRAFYGYTITTSLTFSNAIWMVYLATHGYSALTISLLETLLHLAKFVAEIPTGIFADLLGRRKSLIIFCTINGLQALLYMVPTLPSMIACFTLCGIAYAFRGGADESILWNLAGYADPAEQTARYSKLVSRMFLIMLIGEIIGSGVGGYLGNIAQILPFIAYATVTLLGIIPLLLIPEQKASSNREERSNPLRHLSKGFKAAWHNPTLMGLLLISGLADGGITTIYYFFQLDLHGQGFSLDRIGLIAAAGRGTNFLFTILAPRIMRRLPQRWLVPIFFTMLLLGLLLMSMQQPILSLLGYLICCQAANAVLTPALSTYINERSPEEQRATVLSLQTGLFSAVMVLLFPLFGLGVSNIAYGTVYLWTMATLIVCGLAILGTVWIRNRRIVQ